MSMFDLPEVRGVLTMDRSLDELTWMRVGGPADVFFQPADVDDLAAFLAALAPDVPVFVMGVGSNLIVRDGGIRGVVIRMGRGFNGIEIGEKVVVGAAALDAHVARKAASAGLDLTFLRTIPGTIGGAVRMNAGCYGTYVADVLESVDVVYRDGTRGSLAADALNLQYRQSVLPEGAVIVSATLNAPKDDAAALEQRMTDQLAKRDATQPTKDRTAGSTAWKVIDDAGMRGATRGGAVMSMLHSNFLTNAGGATAADLEELGEDVRKKVYAESGITLQWEIKRVGDTELPNA
jgi:UDP-N-acetylmuramate dehydrogenase